MLSIVLYFFYPTPAHPKPVVRKHRIASQGQFLRQEGIDVLMRGTAIIFFMSALVATCVKHVGELTRVEERGPCGKNASLYAVGRRLRGEPHIIVRHSCRAGGVRD